jgi:hypothetical protein
MKRLTLLAAGIVALVLSACATVAPEQAAATLQAQAKKQCIVVQPFLSSMLAMQSQLSPDAIAKLTDVSGKVSTACAFASSSGASFSLADVQTFANDAIPALIKVIDASAMDQSQKTAAEIAVTAAQVALATAIANAQ